MSLENKLNTLMIGINKKENLGEYFHKSLDKITDKYGDNENLEYIYDFLKDNKINDIEIGYIKNLIR
jgi:hypothetical protein